jgi:hypothetical protein
VPGRVRGAIVAIRETGDLVTDIRRAQLRGIAQPQKLSVTCDGYTTCGIYDGPHREPPSTLLARWGNDDSLELTLVGENASEFLGIGMGAVVSVEW